MKYEPLERFLSDQSRESVPMTFEEIEKLLGTTLPRSARIHRPWWGNNGSNHVHARAWLAAGFRTDRVDMEHERLVFRRIEAEKPTERGPLFGALRNLIRIHAPGTLTEPSGESWNATEGRL